MYKELREVWSELTREGGAFEVVEVKVAGRPLRAYKGAPNSLLDVWSASAGHGERDYLVYRDERWTYDEAHRQVRAIAAGLAASGVKPGDRVAIAMRNYPEWMLSYWATISLGAAAVGMNAWWTDAEMLYGVQDASPRVMICDEERLARFLPRRAEAPNCALVAVRTEAPEGVMSWTDLCANGDDPPRAEIDPDSDACIFYTSGTTGRPKGAQLTHRGCVNNLMSLAFWNTAHATAIARAGKRSADSGVIGSQSPSFLVATPLFHVTANNCVAHSATILGAKLILMYKWEAGEALQLIEREQVTTLSGVPVMSRELMAHPNFPTTDTSSLASLGGGGAPLQPDLVKKIDSGVSTARPNTGYGMTETCGIITANSAEFFVDKPESCGPAMPVFETKCIDADGNSVAPGEVGELCVRGSQVIAGYLNRPEATAEAICDGWLRTGDVARIDEDGFVFIVDRAKDMVLRGGENVYCAEVETAIFAHPDVAECAVFGVPDDRLGEEVGVAVVVAKDCAVTADDLRSFCAKDIAKYKVPRYVWLGHDPLPRNASGKFLKRQLRDDLDIADAS